MGAFTIRPYREEDLPAIADGFELAFGQRPELGYWQWKYKENPFGQPVVSVLEEGARPVGQCLVIPISLNWMGNRIPAVQCLDIFVDPTHQGLGLFEKAAEHNDESCREKGFGVVFAFPNRQSMPTFIKRLEWQRFALLRRYRYRLGIRRVVSHWLKSRLLSYVPDQIFRGVVFLKHAIKVRIAQRTFHFEMGDRLPAELDFFWKKYARGEVLSLWKDESYLKWRYENHPTRSYRFLSVSHAGVLCAFAVVELREAMICEFMVYEKNLRIARSAIAALICHLCRLGLDEIQFCGSDTGFFEDAFRGFEVHADYCTHFCGKALDRSLGIASALNIPENWSVTFGDGDSI